jgi:transposase
MQQIYHANATTNVNIRTQLQNNFSSSNEELSQRFNVSKQTVSKWKNRDFQTDVSSKPQNIKYALSDIEQALIISIRTATWFALDEVYEIISSNNQTV